MKATLTIIEDHPSGEPAAILSFDDESITEETFHHLRKAFERWWHDGGGVLMVGHLEVIRVKKLHVEFKDDEITVLGHE